jgi:Sulfite exporter TauE/SafE
MLIIAALIAFALTTVLSMAGVGAAFVLIPVFLALGVELHTAMATALLLNAIGMSIAWVTFVRKGLFAWRLVLPILLVAVLASPITVHVGQGMDRSILLWLFVGFLVFASGMMLFYRPQPRTAPTSPRAGMLLGVPVGGIAGFVGGLLGVGGGNIISRAGCVRPGAEAGIGECVVFRYFRVAIRVCRPCPGCRTRYRAASRHRAGDSSRRGAGRLAGERETARRSTEANYYLGTDRCCDQDRLGVVVNRILGEYP